MTIKMKRRNFRKMSIKELNQVFEYLKDNLHSLDEITFSGLPYSTIRCINELGQGQSTAIIKTSSETGFGKGLFFRDKLSNNFTKAEMAGDINNLFKYVEAYENVSHFYNEIRRRRNTY